MNRIIPLLLIVFVLVGCDEDEKDLAPRGYKWATHVFTDQPTYIHTLEFYGLTSMVDYINNCPVGTEIIGTADPHRYCGTRSVENGVVTITYSTECVPYQPYRLTILRHKQERMLVEDK